MSDDLNLTNKELLWRIDERVSQLQKQLIKMCESIEKKVNISEFEKFVTYDFNELEKCVKSNTNWRIYVTGAVAVISTAVGFLFDEIKKIIFGG
jgi:hypothetical protein